MVANAQAALNVAKQNLASGNKDEAIADAIHAGQLADTAIGEAHRSQNEAIGAQAADASMQQAQQDAQSQVDAANARVVDDAAASAQDANQRAAAAQENVAAASAPGPMRCATRRRSLP
jgi:hypothetical protein